jgi:hypothetical protein
LGLIRGIRFGTGPGVWILLKYWNKNDPNWNWVLGLFRNQIWNFVKRIRARTGANLQKLNCQLRSKNRNGTGSDF